MTSMQHHALARLMAWRRPQPSLHRMRALHTVYRFLYGRPINEFGELVAMHHMIHGRGRA